LNQSDRFVKNLDAATRIWRSCATWPKQLQQMQAQAEKLGKDSPEQLKYGQADAAQMTLEKLSDNEVWQTFGGAASEDPRRSFQGTPTQPITARLPTSLTGRQKQMKDATNLRFESLADAAKEWRISNKMGDARR